MRQQLLAHELEKADAEGADRVRVVHVRPPENEAYEQSLTPAHRTLGTTVQEVWSALLRSQDPPRYVSLDSAVFADQAVTSSEYVVRYGRDVAHDLPSLLALRDWESLDYLEEHLDAACYYDGDVIPHDEGVELYLLGQGTLHEYPFTLQSLRELAEQVQRETETRLEED